MCEPTTITSSPILRREISHPARYAIKSTDNRANRPKQLISNESRTRSRINDGEKVAAWLRPRVILWTAASVVALGFLIALEIAARHYGLPGPITNQAREVVFAPKSGPLLYASMALMMVVLTWRERFVAAGVAVGIDVAFFLVRWAFDAKMMFGNGALWVVLGYAVIAVTRRTGAERVLLLKGVGLGLLLVAGRKTGDTWLLITSKTRPVVLDQYVATADQALGNPSWLVGRVVRATGSIGSHVLDYVYIQLAVAAVVVALYQLRHVAAERRFPRHHLVRTFLMIGLLGPGIYMIFPVVGPIFVYGAEAGTGRWPTCGRTRHRSARRTTCLSTRSLRATACPVCTRRGPPRSSFIPARGHACCDTWARSG